METNEAGSSQCDVITDPVKIDQILNRGIIVQALPTVELFREKLLSGQRLRFYIGADATSTALHLSHAKNYILLEEFRKLGHEAIVLFGDFTARIGDPSDKDSVRASLSVEDVKRNVQGWLKQIQPLLDFGSTENPPLVKYNSNWLAKLSLSDVIELASNTTVQRMLERDMFEKRIQNEKPIFLHEFMYPLMQGYDSVAMDVDVELCGTDQIFNALMGRTLQKRLKDKEKFVVAVHLMENPLTGDLMSKSRGNGVFLDASPFNMFGQVMAQPDEMIESLLTCITRIPLERIAEVLKMEPMEAKLYTARKITKVFHGAESAKEARRQFDEQVRQKLVPDDLPEIFIEQGDIKAYDLVRRVLNDSISNSQIRRLFKQGAIRYAGEVISDPDQSLTIVKGESVLKTGKRQLFKVKLKG